MKPKFTIGVLVCATSVVCGGTRAATLGPAALVAGAARLDNGSLVTLGQPIVGVTQGGGATWSIGLTPALHLPIVPVLSSINFRQGENLQFNFPTQTGRTYVIEASSSLTANSWVELKSLSGTGSLFSFVDGESTNHAYRFYRVRAQ